MKAVLVLVLLIVAGAAIYYAVTQAAQPPPAPESTVATGDGLRDQAWLDPELPKRGVPAPGEPDFNVDVDLVKAKGRTTFRFTVTEANGWAANGVYVELRHHELPEKTGKGMMHDRRLTLLCRKSPLRFNEPLEYSVTVGAQEFPELDDFGTSENWSAEVTAYSDLTAPKPD